jgi:hypothetical protein
MRQRTAGFLRNPGAVQRVVGPEVAPLTTRVKWEVWERTETRPGRLKHPTKHRFDGASARLFTLRRRLDGAHMGATCAKVNIIPIVSYVIAAGRKVARYR